jgi:hypothetical protein
MTISVHQQQINSALNARLHEEFTREGHWLHLQIITWDLFRTLLSNQLHKPHQQLIKCSVGWLPTGSEVHRHNSLEERRCPHRKTVFKNNAHLLPHPDRASKRHQFLRITMNNFCCTSNTAQPIRELISQSLLQWFRNPAIAPRFPCTHPLFCAASHRLATTLPAWTNSNGNHRLPRTVLP